MFCSKCGKKIPEDSSFCPFCGENIVHGEESAPSEHAASGEKGTQAGPLPVRGVPMWQHIAIIVGTIFIPLIGLMFGVYYLRSADAAKKKAGKIWLWVGIVAFLINLLFIFMA